MIVFFDASALIYLIEARDPFGTVVRKALAEITARHPDSTAAVSRLTWLECRAGPLKAEDARTLAAYDAFFGRPDLQWLELSRNVVELATVIRVRHGLRTPDALQAASCLQCGPDHLFLTGDGAFGRVAGLKVHLLQTGASKPQSKP